MTASFVPRRNDSGRSLDPIPQDASEKARTAATTLRASMGDPPALNLSEARGSQRIAKATGPHSQYVDVWTAGVLTASLAGPYDSLCGKPPQRRSSDPWEPPMPDAFPTED